MPHPDHVFPQMPFAGDAAGAEVAVIGAVIVVSHGTPSTRGRR